MVRPVKAWLISIAGLAGFLLVSWALLTYALPFVLPFAIAGLLAELMDPAVSWLTRKCRIPRGFSVLLVLVLLVGVITTVLTAAIAGLINEIQSVYGQLPYLYAVATDLGTKFAQQFGAFHANLPTSIQGILMDNLVVIQKKLNDTLPTVLGSLGAVSSLPAFITNSLVALIATFFLSRDKRKIFDFLLSLFPRTWQPKLQRVKADVWTSAMGWAKAQFTLILLTMVESMIGLTLIGSHYAVLLGAIIGLADLLPLLGPATIYLPWIAYCLVFGNTLFGIKLLVVYGVIAGIRQVLEAKMVGDQIGLHPLAILVAIYLGFQVFGSLGFVVGPLLAIVLKSMIKSELLPIFRE